MIQLIDIHPMEFYKTMLMNTNNNIHWPRKVSKSLLGDA
jgi:hypothetical protein